VVDKDPELRAVAALVAQTFLRVHQQKTGRNAGPSSNWRAAGRNDLSQ
jgi:hypothetical protein